MKWFKHQSTSLGSNVIQEAIELFGGDGYLGYFGTLEIVSDDFERMQQLYKIKSPGFWRGNLQIFRKNWDFLGKKPSKFFRFFKKISAFFTASRAMKY
jgi:hypothetical protein